MTPMSPMAYITNLPNGFSDKEVIRIGRRLTTLERGQQDKQYEQIMHAVIISPISAGTTFEVIAVFTIVHNSFSRVFAHDFDVVVLQDNEGEKSTMLLSEFQEYVKEPAGGAKNETTTP